MLRRQLRSIICKKIDLFKNFFGQCYEYFQFFLNDVILICIMQDFWNFCKWNLYRALCALKVFTRNNYFGILYWMTWWIEVIWPCELPHKDWFYFLLVIVKYVKQYNRAFPSSKNFGRPTSFLQWHILTAFNIWKPFCMIPDRQ